MCAAVGLSGKIALGSGLTGMINGTAVRVFSTTVFRIISRRP